jgi:hypothetical protein
MICSDCNKIMETKDYRFIVISIPPDIAKYIKPFSKSYCLVCIGKLNNIFGQSFDEK